jgi:alpha-beta hydrolase superfamily lysophospholipase
MARKISIVVLALVGTCLGLSAIVGWAIAPEVLHPYRAPMDARRLARVDEMLLRTHAVREDFDVRASDGVVLRGWKLRPANPDGNWVMLFHGQGDNRAGMAGFAEFLLHAGYSVAIMDSRAQGESGGESVTYGWKERSDTCEVVSALELSEKVRHLFALGVSMGAAIALQSAAIEPRIEGVVAEDPFADLREVSYDYAGLRRWPWLGMTLFRPASIEGMRVVRADGGFDPDAVSPEQAVAERPFPVLLICGTVDHTILCRHAEVIYNAARGPKELWIVQGARHASAYGVAPEEYERRVLAFFHRTG